MTVISRLFALFNNAKTDTSATLLQTEASTPPPTTRKSPNKLLLALNKAGFSLIELVVVIAIIGILASISTMFFHNQYLRSKYSEVILAADQVKDAIDLCLQTNRQPLITQCNRFDLIGVNQAELTSAPYVDDIQISTSGEIIARTITGEGLLAETYQLNLVISANRSSWQIDPSSSCLAKGYC